MKAKITFNEQQPHYVFGEDLKISTNPLMGEFRVYDGDKCVFYSSVSKVEYAIIYKSETEGAE